jgi:hypothetical protein
MCLAPCPLPVPPTRYRGHAGLDPASIAKKLAGREVCHSGFHRNPLPAPFFLFFSLLGLDFFQFFADN